MMIERMFTLWKCLGCGKRWDAPTGDPAPVHLRRPNCSDCGCPAEWRGETPMRVEVAA